MKYMYKLVGCKYLPFYFRQFCWFATDDLEQLKSVEVIDKGADYSEKDITETPCTSANTAFYSSIGDMKLIAENVFHFHHLRLSLHRLS